MEPTREQLQAEILEIPSEVPPEANMGILCRNILEHQQPQGIRTECQGRS